MGEALKNLFNRDTIEPLVNDITAVYPSFDTSKFYKLVFNKNWNKLELKERMHHVAVSLHEVLPKDYEEAVKIIIKAAMEKFPVRKTSFVEIALPDFVAAYGLDYPEISLDALEVLTPYPSSEWGVRPFILKYPDLTIKRFYKWSRSDNHHVRRFASEGSRPRLPWGLAIPAFKKDPSPIIPILESLLDDPHEYVRLSVSNSLNDISKDNPAILIDFVARWFGKNDNINKLLKHACRTLLKKGDKRVLAFFGFDYKTKVDVSKFKLAEVKIKKGEDLKFSFRFINKGSKPEKVRLEYKIYYVKSTGKLSAKVFKIGENVYKPGKLITVSGKQSFKDLTTRKHFPGKHKIIIVVNGKESAEKDFILA